MTTPRLGLQRLGLFVHMHELVLLADDSCRVCVGANTVLVQTSGMVSCPCMTTTTKRSACVLTKAQMNLQSMHEHAKVKPLILQCLITHLQAA